MFSSSLKMLVRPSNFIGRSVATSLFWLATLSPLAHAQQTPPAFTWPLSTGLRVGEPAPQFQLPDKAGNVIDSRAFLGQKPLFLLLDNAPASLDFNEEVGKAAQRAVEGGAALVRVTPESGPKAAPEWPSPFSSLKAPQSAFQGVTTPSFLVVDRAGWLRDFQPLPSTIEDTENVQLRFLLTQTADPTPSLAVGKAAPDFSFRDSKGNWRRVSALRGRKNLLLTFFPKCFTGKCRSQLSSLRDRFPGLLASNTEVWAVSVDEADGETGQNAFARELNLPFPLLPDVNRNICLLYGAANASNELAQRQSVLIDKDGIVRWFTRNVSVMTHGEDVLAKVAEFSATH